MNETARVVGCTPATVGKRFPDLARRNKDRTASGDNTVRLGEHEINTAATLAAYGASPAVIARTLRTTEKTLLREAGDAMEIAVMQVNAHAAKFLFEQMRAGSTQATIFWLKARGGAQWRDTQHIAIDGKVGVLVAPGRVEPNDWIEMEEKRTSGGPLTGSQEHVERIGRETVATFVAAQERGAAAPFEDTADDAELAVPEFNALPVAELGLPRVKGDEEWDELLGEADEWERQIGAVDDDVAALLG